MERRKLISRREFLITAGVSLGLIPVVFAKLYFEDYSTPTLKSPYLGDYTRILFENHDTNEGKGAGGLVRYKDKIFIATVGHVVDHIKNRNNSDTTVTAFDRNQKATNIPYESLTFNKLPVSNSDEPIGLLGNTSPVKKATVLPLSKRIPEVGEIMTVPNQEGTVSITSVIKHFPDTSTTQIIEREGPELGPGDSGQLVIDYQGKAIGMITSGIVAPWRVGIVLFGYSEFDKL
jgi:hypothetical protein